MAKDERAEEAEFLAGLKARTRRDLAEWMAAIAEQGLSDRNAIIDWLRAQGLPFARASWLERIHNNAGKPIYSDAPPSPTAAPQAAPARPAAPAPPELSPADAAQLEKLIAAGKGYRPLYLLLEDAIRTTVPGVTIAPKSGHVSFGAPAEFAALAALSTELRLGLDLGERAFDAKLLQPKIKGAGPRITHMLVLTDARQVNADLLDLITIANTRANG
jgi:hypothetical protein